MRNEKPVTHEQAVKFFFRDWLDNKDSAGLDSSLKEKLLSIADDPVEYLYEKYMSSDDVLVSYEELENTISNYIGGHDL